MSGSKDIFAQKLKESQEQGLRLQEELQKRQGNELSSIFLTRNKPSTAQVGKPLDRGLFQQKSVAYHDMFTSKNNIDHMLESNFSSKIVLANPVSPNQLDGKASNSSLIERIRQIDAKKVEVKGESTNQYSKPSSDPRKQTIILGGRQLGYHSTYNRESDTTIMKQEIENSERERSRLAREAKEVHLREQQQREEEKRRKENIVKKELALREEARKEEEEKMKEKQADLAVGKSNIKRKRKQIQDEKIRQQLKNDEKLLSKDSNLDIGEGLKMNSMSADIFQYRKDYSYLLRRILNYNYFTATQSSLSFIPDNFKSAKEYVDCFVPMFAKECICNIEQQLASMARHLFALKVSEWKFEFVRDENNGLVLYDVDSSQADETLYLSNCIVLISPVKDKNNIKNVNKPCDDFMILGITCDSAMKNKKQVLISEEFDKLIKKHNKIGPLYVWKMEKVITCIREYLAIKNIEFDFMADFIYQPKSSQKMFEMKHDYSDFQRFFDSIRDKFNHSQFSSIQNICLTKQGIKLLQGPPGTGKTHTLLGIVSGIYHYIKTDPSNCRKHILICAPSNYAVDEIILRIVHKGIFDQDGQRIHPKVVRLGVTDKSKTEEIKKYTVEYLAEKEVKAQRGKAAPKEGVLNGKLLSELRNDLDTIDEQMRFLVEAGKGDSTEYASLNEARGKLVNQIIDKKSQTREEKEFFEKAIEKILSEAEIICCTLNSSGSEKLDRYYHNIEAIIVDEAAQCTEPSNIIPLRFKANKLILIGDPKQLPATTFNEQNSVTKYNRSLFEVGAVYTEIP